MLIKPKAGQAAKIKVVGVGGGGGNAINSMIKEGGIEGVEFVAVNTDAQALLHNKADIKVQIGDQLTKGLGSGGDPEMGRQAAEESREKLKDEFGSADMIFITCGEGGGTGTGASPIVAEIARQSGALTVAVVTKPFDFEGAPRKVTAAEGIDSLKENVDTLIVIPNQRVLQVIDKKTSILDAFKKIDSVLYQGVKGIAELITLPGLINVDFADVRSIMQNAGNAIMGMGIGSGDKRAISAIRQAISSPLLDTSIDGAKGILLNIVGGEDLSMSEIDEAATMISKAVDPDANIIFGAAIDERLQDQIKITVIATRFDESRMKLFKFQRPGQESPSNDREKKSTIEQDNDLSLYPPEVKQEDEEDRPTPPSTMSADSDEFDIPAFLRRK
ncbi:cell division protein FtsZ [Candidatus Roizmanbacteria bacterium CG_4_9_14_0_2_um_filter_39_13]|uniref:Cell division protein FtsZ n=2 Tax=Candidatus Roizmaniibacteriota TaxID=1752723 RepID=A0A2M8EWI9_9BACT|nr:MAG: cell division protein FtsZ [Candidatus Roizmanbacteria bacterium CG_4_10_14_0_2_um_filter_39_12]PJC30232.1 MAG: cell division protein FtsZ [Candidatus Roizmanbacteria bacterium CG_4_9_14_0_2_um_filter_39_13]PJE62245.1 MAG: cell division protein FtsZ [Candidatus Roizmanbacteria bacterium CG10_big_fil_rev_8_21_14_0_10_39_12]